MTEDEARERVIRSMCPEKVCRVCGEPSRRIVGEAEYVRDDGTVTAGDRRHGWTSLEAKDWGANTSKGVRESGHVTRTNPTLGFTDCGHDDWRPGVWIDPFQNESEGVMLTLGNIDEKCD